MKSQAPTQVNKIKFQLNGEIIEFTPMTLDEAVQAIFLIIPFAKYLKEIQKAYNNNLIGSEQFRAITETLLALSNKDNVLKAFSIMYHLPVEKILAIPVDDFVLTLPVVLKENRILELLYTFKALGAFNE